MVDAANQQIRTAIENSRPAFEARGIPILVADWDDYVGRISGRFCEEGAPANPDDNFSLAFQRQDNIPQFIPPEKLLAGNTTAFQSHTASRKIEDLELTKRSILPDAWTGVFHPNSLDNPSLRRSHCPRLQRTGLPGWGATKKLRPVIYILDAPLVRKIYVQPSRIRNTMKLCFLSVRTSNVLHLPQLIQRLWSWGSRQSKARHVI